MAIQSLPADADLSDRRSDDAAYYRGILHALIDMGTDLARMVHEEAKAKAEQAVADQVADAAPATEAVPAFERIARTVRRTIRLAQTLDAPVREAGLCPEGERVAVRKRIIRVVEDVIQREAEDESAAELHAEFLDRLDRPELEEEIGDRPVDEIIADICRDLGLCAAPGTRPWKRRTPEDVAVLCARAAGMADGRWGLAEAERVDGGTLRQAGQAGCRGP